MTKIKTVALSLAAVLVSASMAATADAATRQKPMHHSTSHSGMTSSHMTRHSGATGSATSADRSADALNAQSLARAQGAPASQ